MPVLVTNADTSFGTAVVRRLLTTGGQVRAYCSATGEAGPLRQAGAIAAGGDVDDEGRLEAACAQVHTVIHLGGGLLSSSPERIVADAMTVATAASNAGVRRLVMLSVVGASPSAGDQLRRAKAEAEQIVASAEIPSVVLRTGLVVDGALQEILAGTPLPPHLASHAVRTVPVDALIEALWMLDEMRSSATSGHAVLVAAGGPPRPLSAVVDSLGEVSGTYRPLDQLPMLAAGLLGPWDDTDPVSSDAWALTGVDPAKALA